MQLAIRRLEVEVVGPPGSVFLVQLTTDRRHWTDLRFDAAARVFYLVDDVTGPAVVRVSVNGRPVEERDVLLTGAPLVEGFLVDQVPGPRTWRGRRRVPYRSQPGLIGVLLHGGAPVGPDILVAYGLAPSQVASYVFDLGGADPVAVVGALRVDPRVYAAGPLCSVAGGDPAIFTGRLRVRFRADVSRREIHDTLADVLGRGGDFARLSFAAGLFEVDPPGTVGEEVTTLAERLLARGNVVFAEPVLAGPVRLHSTAPLDELWPLLWAQQRIGLPAAWDGPAGKGAPITVGIFDLGFGEFGLASQRDLDGRVLDNSYQTLADGVRDWHGLHCAGVLAAGANNVATTSATRGATGGTVGVAPGVRLLPLLSAQSTRDHQPGDENTLRWAAGLARPDGAPELPDPPAALFSCSFGYENAPLGGATELLLQELAFHGRDGRGCPFFISAGDYANNIFLDGPWGWSQYTFSCGATTIDHEGDESRALYSSWGRLEWCAPSSYKFGPSDLDLPHRYVLATTEDPSTASTKTSSVVVATSPQPHPGSSRIPVDDVTPFLGQTGRALILGDPSAGGEAFYLNQVDQTHGTLELQPEPASTHDKGTDVYLPADVCTFGETSAAAPLCAGVGALVLSTQPSLTWIEAREILRSTAVHHDLYISTLDSGSTVNKRLWDGLGRSEYLGYGRLDALAAVNAAAAHDPRAQRSHEIVNVWILPPTGPVAAASAVDHPQYGQDHRIAATIRNNGTETGYELWVRFHLAPDDNGDLKTVEDWTPINGEGNLAPGIWTKGTYLIDETSLAGIPGNGGTAVAIVDWPASLQPPASFAPQLLVEITPQDGRTPAGDPIAGFDPTAGNPCLYTQPLNLEGGDAVVDFSTQRGSSWGPAETRIGLSTAPRTVSFRITVWHPTRALTASDVTVTSVHVGRDGSTSTTVPSIYDSQVDAGVVTLYVAVDAQAADAEVTVRVSVNGTAAPFDCTFEVVLPVCLALALDYSGSMRMADGTRTHWDVAQEAAATVQALLGKLLIDSDVAAASLIGTVRFAAGDSDDLVAGLQTSLAEVSTAFTAFPMPPAQYATPVGGGVLAARDMIDDAPTGDVARSRAILLLTDGQQNRAPYLAEIQAAGQSDTARYLPSIVTGPSNGFAVHACAFGPEGEAASQALHAFVEGTDVHPGYGGKLYWTPDLGASGAPSGLLEAMLDMLGEIVGAERVQPDPGTSDHTLWIEPGVTRAVFVVRPDDSAVPLELLGPTLERPHFFDGSVNQEVTLDPLTVVGTPQFLTDVRVAVVESPRPGPWRIRNTNDGSWVAGGAVVDLRLRSRFSVSPARPAPGDTLSLVADLREDGRPVTGAEVVVSVDGPGESVPALLTAHVAGHVGGKGSKFDKVAFLNRLKFAGPAVTARTLLLRDALAARALKNPREAGLVRVRRQVVLRATDVPGRYVGQCVASAAPGPVSLRFEARGTTRSGQRFARVRTMATHLVAAPDTAATRIDLSDLGATGARTRWRITLEPRDAKGAPLGPGLTDTLRLRVGQRRPVDLVDNLDGTYTAEFEAKAGLAPPPLWLHHARGRTRLAAP
jgi:hypothetical protein